MCAVVFSFIPDCINLFTGAEPETLSQASQTSEALESKSLFIYVDIVFLYFLRFQVTVGGVQCNPWSSRRVCASFKEGAPAGDFPGRCTGGSLQ